MAATIEFARPGQASCTPALIGRQGEGRLLEDLIDAVRGGQGRALVVRGDPGVGKTALVDHAVGLAAGFEVTRATPAESEAGFPFAVLHQLCAPLLGHMDGLPGPQRSALGTAFGLIEGTAPDRFFVGLAALNLLAQPGVSSPRLWVVDDAQWLDRESAQALAFVARRLRAEPIGLVLAVRAPDPDLHGLPELVLEGLRDADARVLLDAALRAPVDPRVRDRVVAETRGNPGALLQWHRGLTSSQLAGGFGSPAGPAPSDDTFQLRMAELPEATQRLLLVAAADPTGDPVVVWRAAARLGIDCTDAPPATDAGLFELGRTVRFSHPHVRSLVYGTAPADARQAVHRALADVTDGDIDPDRRAWHRALATPAPDEDVARALDDAAARAQSRGGLGAAAALLERAAFLTPDPAQRAGRTLAAAEATFESGGFEGALRLLAAAEAEPLDEIGRTAADVLRSRVTMASGHGDDHSSLLLGAAARAVPVDVRVARDAYLHALAAANSTGSLAGTVTLTEVARAAGLAPDGSHRRRVSDLLLDGLSRLTAEGPEAAAPALRQAIAAFGTGTEDPDGDDSDGDDSDGDDPDRDDTDRWLALGSVAASVLWDGEHLRALAARWVRQTRQVGALASLPAALDTLALAQLYEGELESAASTIGEARTIIETTGSKVLRHAAPYLAALHGRVPEAEAQIQAQIETATLNADGAAVASAQWARATLCNGLGRFDEALTAAQQAARSHPGGWGSQLALPELVEGAVRGGCAAVADDAVERLCGAAAASGGDWALGVLARTLALLSDARPNTAGSAEALYGEAIERLGRTAARVDLARAHLLYGEWLGGQGRRTDAREHLGTAHEMFGAMGMEGFAERAGGQLRATGGTVRKQTPDHAGELTAQELQIVRLAAEGRSNPEIGAELFISARTVEWHLRKVFAKLNVRSRRELPRVLPAVERSALSA